MPFPVIAGLPWLAGIFTGLFASLVQFVAQYLTKRLAVVLAAVLVLVGVTSTFLAGAYALLGTVQATAPASIAMGMAVFMPSNMAACISVVASAHVLKWAYSWQVRVVQYRLF